ncbi:MAG: GC-type dockerin domain-anchored protein [Phycisphaerales bacterium JB059]
MRGVIGACGGMLALGATALGGGTGFIEVGVEPGVVEVVVEIAPPDAAPTQHTFLVEIDEPSDEESVVFGDANVGGEITLSLEVSDFAEPTNVSFTILFDAGQAEQGYGVEARVRSLEPVRLRLFETAEIDFFSPEGSLDLVPVSGAFDGANLCPGTYAITFDETFVLSPDDAFASEGVGMQFDLNVPETPDVAFVFTSGAGLRVEGVATDDEGNEQTAFSPGTIDPGVFAATGCTSSGLADGLSTASGEITRTGGGAFAMTLIAESSATQPEGYQGAVFIGAIADGVVFELRKPMNFAIASTGAGSVTLTPQTGSVQGDRLMPGRYAISFNASAFLSPGQTDASSTIDWTLELRPPPCNASDLSAPSGVLDFADVLAFLGAFGGAEPAADLSPPQGTFDFADVIAFLQAFGAGCP